MFPSRSLIAKAGLAYLVSILATSLCASAIDRDSNGTPDADDIAAAARGRTTRHVDDDNCPGPGSGVQADPFCSIQDGIDASLNGDEVLVSPGTYNEVIDFLGKAITVRSSSGAAVTTIDGTGLNDSVVQCVSGESPDTVFDGFAVTGGTGRPSGFGALSFLMGGGMYNAGSSPTVTNCTFSGNSAEAQFPVVFGIGGGMYNDGSSPTVTNCTFSGNSAGGPGGGSGGGMANSWGSNPVVTNCILWGNTADFQRRYRHLQLRSGRVRRRGQCRQQSGLRA